MPNNIAGTRSRRPQGIWDDSSLPAQGITKQTPVPDVAVCTVADLDPLLASSNGVAGENGYSTQNQRYLHIYWTHTALSQWLVLWGYNYATGRWGVINFRHAAAASGGASVPFAPISERNPAGTWHFIVPIHGIDRVAFQSRGIVSPSTVIQAAVSTF